LETTERLDIEDFLAELKSERQPVLFIPNSGNAGDALIGHATFQLFERLDLDYECPVDYRRFDPSGRVVLCGGGGNLVPPYDGTERVLRWAGGRARRVILLPHTIRGNNELLANLGPEVDLICRETVSFSHVNSTVRAAHCHLADDMAFSLDLHATLSAEPALVSQLSLYARKAGYKLFQPSRLKSVPSPWKIRRNERLMACRRAALSPGGAPAGVLHAFRTDLEKTAVPLPTDNLDLASEFSHGTKNPHVCHTGSFRMLRYLDTFEEVHSNRLHVSIGAALLGKRVKFWPNSYFKNRAVYEFSMRDRFSNVEWVEAECA
jgi:exopolysaccharide biosynthesis predicted pyruvyltransferase EpsI